MANDQSWANPGARANPGVALSAIYRATSTGLSGGNAALNWALTSTDEGATLTISTDSTHDFGIGPTLSYYETLASVSDGGEVPHTPLAGDATLLSEGTSLWPVVEDVAGLPYGKGIVVGSTDVVSNRNSTLSRRMFVQDPEHTEEFFEALCIYWPQSHQEAAQEYLDASSTWQVKSWWHEDDRQSGATENNVFGGFPFFSAANDYFTQGDKLSGNSGTSGNGGIAGGSAMMATANTKYWRNTVMFRELWAKSGPTIGSAVGSDGGYSLVDSAIGEVNAGSFADAVIWAGASVVRLGWDGGVLPGYVRGFHVAAGAHMYFATPYKARGPGAAARIVIADSATWASRKKYTICTVDLPGNWTSTEVLATLRKGIFYIDGVELQHIFLVKADNTPLYVGQIGA